MPSKAKIWPLEPHTLGKHKVLQSYMEAWLPIMTKWNGRVLFIDGFAGPGKYKNGELGSPLIALRALTKHSARNRMNSEIRYLFIEEDSERASNLEQLLQAEIGIPENCTYKVFKAAFDKTLTDVLNELDAQKNLLAPSFVMLDPFGVSDTPMDIIGRILANPKSEVYISFMYEAINRFKDHENFEPHLDDLFGCPDWREGINEQEPGDRKEFFIGLYKRQLREAGAKYVLHFELFEGKRLIYAIFFGTDHLEGCDKMKQAIWKVAPFGDYRFLGGRSGQPLLGNDVLDYSPLEEALQREFKFREKVRIEDVTNFTMSDETEFHTGHLKVKTLKPMERKGKLEVVNDNRKRKGSFPNGTILRFL